ncbi:hypothetical protein ABKW28_22585 [Nocardioides sp. 31GB23]|uniref:hypothetical protein n=1 Tax=Nocardioides sp. 31GB23 TaxID=3156065 RepID=UPI0032AF0390
MLTRLLLAPLLVLGAGCSTDEEASRSSDRPAAAVNRATPSESTPLRTIRDGGLVFKVPKKCQLKDTKATACAGLRRIIAARTGPTEDLIKPGIHRQRSVWVGLTTIGGSHLYAVADANGRASLRELMDSAVLARS